MKLADYLSDQKLSPSAFAAVLESPASTVTRLLRGERAPTLALVARIRTATNGAVTADDFLPPASNEAA